jgi:putative copper export protein
VKRWMPLVDTLTALALVAWLGGIVALGAFAARIIFRELPLDVAAPTMNAIFRSFDGVIVACLVVVAVTTGVRLMVNGLRSRPDRIALVAGTALTVLGALDVGYVHPGITRMFREGRTQEPAFAALHQLSRRSVDLEAICAILILGALAWSPKRPS